MKHFATFYWIGFLLAFGMVLGTAFKGSPHGEKVDGKTAVKASIVGGVFSWATVGFMIGATDFTCHHDIKSDTNNVTPTVEAQNNIEE